MRKYLLAAGFAAVALAIAAPTVEAQGPVRRGMRRSGEIAVQGTQRVVQGAAQGTRAVVGGAAQGTRAVVGGAVQGTRAVVGGAANATGAVIGGAADATRAVVGGTADATRAVVGGTARGIGAGIDALTPNIPLQARAGATLNAGDQGRDARWRFAQHNGDWWYYTPENSWMYQRDGQWNQFAEDSFQPNAQFSGEFATGYRGIEGGAQVDQYGAAGGQHATLHHDQHGRGYICENGHRVYVDAGQNGQQGMTAGEQQQGGQPTPAPAIPTEAGTGQTGTSAQPSTSLGAEAGASGGLSAESPKEVLQTSPDGTMGTVEPGQTGQ